MGLGENAEQVNGQRSVIVEQSETTSLVKYTSNTKTILSVTNARTNERTNERTTRVCQCGSQATMSHHELQRIQ